MVAVNTRTLRAFLGSISIIATAGIGTSASAQYSMLFGQVSATGTGTFNQSHSNVQYASLTGVETTDAIGNASKANGSVATPDGRISLSSHACSGGGPGFGGQANARANGQVILDYLIKSSTLPNGTPVSVNVRWAVSSSVMAVAQDLQGINSGAVGSAYGQIVIAIGGVGVLNKSGAYTRTHSVGGGGITNDSTGTLHMQQDEGDHTYNVLVGQIIRINFSGTGDSASGASGTTQTDGDVQMGLVWGVTSLNPNAVAVWNNDQTQPAPPAAGATQADAQGAQPPRDPYLMPCFWFPNQPVSAVSCVSGAPGFGVAPHGTGPFTYQWQIEGEPGSWIDLGAVAVALPCGGSAGASNATSTQTNIGVVPCVGVSTYLIRCVVTNPCGSVASNTVALDLCAADIDCSGGVGVPDLLSIIGQWGQCPRPPAQCAGDVQPIGGNQVVGVPDLLAAINSWGECQ